MMRRSTSELHKFMSADRAISFLSSRTIRFTQPDFLNDPYECHLTIDRAARKDLLDDFERGYREHFPQCTNEEVKERVKANESMVIEHALLRYRNIRNDLGVLSLSENPLNLLMWAHYGDEHRGVVVELDFTHPSLLRFSAGGNEFSHLCAVRYTKEKVCGAPTPDNVIQTLITKSPEWEYELEWRFIRTLNLLKKVNDRVYVAEIDPKAIKRVILGARFPAERLPEIMREIRVNDLEHVRVEKAVMIPNQFGLRLVDPGKFGWTLLHREHHFGDVANEALLCLTMDEDENQDDNVKS